MAKILIQHDEDPGIAIMLTEVRDGYYGECTQCGTVVFHHREADAMEEAAIHVDKHEAADV